MALAAALGGLYEALHEDRVRQEKEQEDRRAYKEKVITALIHAGRVDAVEALKFDPWKDDMSKLKLTPQQLPSDILSSLQHSHPGMEFDPSVSIGPHGTTVSYHPKNRLRPTQPKIPMLTEPQSEKTFAGSQPGRPLPGSPFTPAGMNTAQQLITRGAFESPAAVQQQAPGALAQLAAWFQSMRQRPLQQQAIQHALAQRQGQGATAVVPYAASGDPIIQRIQELRARGVPSQVIAHHLRAKGIDPSQYGL